MTIKGLLALFFSGGGPGPGGATITPATRIQMLRKLEKLTKG